MEDTVSFLCTAESISSSLDNDDSLIEFRLGKRFINLINVSTAIFDSLLSEKMSDYIRLYPE